MGWLLAGVIASTSRRLLRRTRLDRLVSSGQDESAGNLSLERWIATIIFWVILVLAVVAALNVLNLAAVSEPLNEFLNQIFAFLPKLGAAAVLAAVGWPWKSAHQHSHKAMHMHANRLPGYSRADAYRPHRYHWK